jgi:general secretion pathway protein F
MAQYEVSAADRNGKTIKMLVEAESVKAARAKARAQGLTPIDVTAADGALPSSGGGKDGAPKESIFASPFASVSPQEISSMTRQLASLVKAHVPVVESLSAIVEQAENMKLKKVLMAVRQDVREGQSLGDGFGRHPKLFDRVYVNMIRAGESSGKLDSVLLRLADVQEANLRLKNQISGALTYPILMVVMAFLVVGFILVKVVPEITGMFKDAGKALPTPTVILISISDFFIANWKVMLVGGLAIAIAVQRFFATPKGRAWKDLNSLKVPVVGDLVRKVSVARFARTLGTLLKAGVPMLTALQITRNVVDHDVFEKVLDDVANQVKEGRSLNVALKQSRQFPPIVVHMTGVGEKTGELEDMLSNIAGDYEGETQATLGKLTSLLNPLLMIVMAGAVGFIVMAVLLPIFEMGEFA